MTRRKNLAVSKRIFNFQPMKKLLIVAALAFPVISFATPAETAETASLAVNMEQIQDLNTLEDYQMYRKGRTGDSGFRSMDYKPFTYNNEGLVNHLYQENIGADVEKPGVVFQHHCYHWKNCLKDSYRATNGYGRSYKKFAPTRTGYMKAKTRGNMRGRKNQLDGERSGLYKIERWRR